MATHSSVLTWKIHWMEEPGGLQSMGSLWVGHGWATSLSLFTFLYWRRQRQPTPEFLHGKSHGQRSLVGCSPWGCYESGTTEQLHFHFSLSCIGEGNGHPLQCSRLENPRNRGAWWAAVYVVAKSQTWLRRLSSSSSVYQSPVSFELKMGICETDELQFLYCHLSQFICSLNSLCGLVLCQAQCQAPRGKQTWTPAPEEKKVSRRRHLTLGGWMGQQAVLGWGHQGGDLESQDVTMFLTQMTWGPARGSGRLRDPARARPSPGICRLWLSFSPRAAQMGHSRHARGILGSEDWSRGTDWPLRRKKWKITWTECQAGSKPWGNKESDTTERLRITCGTRKCPAVHSQHSQANMFLIPGALELKTRSLGRGYGNRSLC